MDREAGNTWTETGSTWTETGRTWTDTGSTINASINGASAELEEDEVTADILVLGAGMAGISAAKGSHQVQRKANLFSVHFWKNSYLSSFFFMHGKRH